MEDVNKAIPTKAANNHGLKGQSDIILDPPEPPTVGNALYTRIADNLYQNMLNGEKAEEYGACSGTFSNDGSAATIRKWMPPS